MKHGLLSYLGFPIILPNGSVFGTVCVLDRQPRHYTGSQRRLLANVGKLIEGQLSMVPQAWGARGDPDGISAEMRVIERTQQLRRSTALLQAVMDGATDAIFLKDTSGTFLIFNKAAATFINRPATDVIGRKAEDIFPAETCRQIRAHELPVLRTGIATTVEEIIVANGQVRTFLTTRSVQRDEDGKITGLIGIARNITAMKQAEQARMQAEEELKRSYEALRQAAEALGIARRDGGRARGARQGRFPGGDEPRNPHTDEHGDRHDASCAQYRADRPAAEITWKRSTRRPARCSTSSMTCSISPKSRPAA